MSSRSVLIVGAGPTGLVLALMLARQGVPFRIIDKNSGPGQASRAMAVHARTLEFYAQLGFADEVVELGVKMERIHLRESGYEVARLSLKDIGEGLSPYPFVLCFAQDDHERFLVEKLQAAGIEVEWGVELKDFSHSDAGVTATLDRAGTDEQVEVDYLCGCDGAHSRVRTVLNLGFPGGTYPQLFYVADVALKNDPGTDLFVNLGATEFALMLPVRSSGMHRLIGVMPKKFTGRTDLSFEDVRADAEPLLGVQVAEVNWFSTYHVHHRVAAHFRQGRCFVAGDAGHVHSPAGGQGMNTGIGDAVNLSWKLANVLQGRADSSLLDSYESERIAFARRLVASTDRGFQGITQPGLWGHLLRKSLIPHVAPLAMGISAVRRLAFTTISQTGINYHASPLSEGKAGNIRGGHRLPWVHEPGSGTGNFNPLQALDWQLHVYGAPAPDLLAVARTLGLPIQTIDWSGAAQAAGLERDAAYLVRPDGYVALASIDQSGKELEAYAGRLKLTGSGPDIRMEKSAPQPPLIIPNT